MGRIRGAITIALVAIVIALLLVAACSRKPAQEPSTPQPQAVEQPKEQPQQPAEQPKQEPAAEFKFISSADKPQGCASCHVKQSEDKDYTLAAEIKRIEKHPPVSAEKVTDCMTCHKEGPLAFKAVLHKVHLEGQDNQFVTNYGGACVQCHKLTAKGEVFVAGLEPAGTTFTTVEAATVDKAPDGCLSCHKKISEDKDYSLSAEIKQIPKHPSITAEKPSDCLTCHKEGPIAFKTVIHKVHLIEGENYKSNYGNSCLNCHTKSSTGEMKVKGL